MEYILLCICWIIWCFLHSVLVSKGASERLHDLLGRYSGYYRILYNFFALVTVLPLFYWQRNIPGPIVIPLSSLLLLFKYTSVVMSLIIIAGSFLSFDVAEFIGISRRESGKDGTVIQKKGFYGVVRHPMYLGGTVFFLASATNAPPAEFLGFMILAAYMIIGTCLEDRRLSRELGSIYREYQEEVPMLIPRVPFRRNDRAAY